MTANVGHNGGPDFAADAAETNTVASREGLNQLILKQLTLEADLKELEDQTKAKKQELDRVQQRDLPEMMLLLDIRKMTTAEGAIVEVKDDLSISVPKDPEKRSKIFEWLRQKKLTNIISSNFTIPFTKGEEEKVEKLRVLLEEHKIDYTQGDEVNSASLKKHLKESIENGENVVLTEFGAYAWKKSVISFKK